MKPNFLVLGAAKAGTTWLQVCLEEHPEIFVPLIKEIHYFSYPKKYQKGNQWYQSFFKNCAKEKAIGEISPSYLASLEAPQRIYDFNPNMRLLIVLRNPIERAYSHYCMSLCTNSVSKDIDRVLSPNTSSNSLVSQGMYHDHIARYTELFAPQNIKILIYEDLVKNSKSFIEEVYSFLEVNSSFAPSVLNKRSNQKKTLPKYEKIFFILQSCQEWLKKNSTQGEAAINYLRRSGYFNLLHKLNRSEEDFPKLSRESEKKLAAFYQKDVELMSRILERDLSFWLEPYH